LYQQICSSDNQVIKITNKQAKI